MKRTTHISMPEVVRRLVEAHAALVQAHRETGLRFTLDGRLVGDIAETLAAAHFDLEICKKRTPGVDAKTRDGKTVQVKSSAIGKGPAFSPGEGQADHLIFLLLDFDQCAATIAYNVPESRVRALLPEKFYGTKRARLSFVQALDAQVLDHERIKHVRSRV